MWLNKKLKLSQDDRWVVVRLKAGYGRETFPPTEGGQVSVNFYKFIGSLTNDPVGIYVILNNQTLSPDNSYMIGNTAPPEKKIWKYERDSQRLFFGTMTTLTGTRETQNQNADEINYDLVLFNVTAITDGFVLNDNHGGQGRGQVLRQSWTEKPFKGNGTAISWESF